MTLGMRSLLAKTVAPVPAGPVAVQRVQPVPRQVEVAGPLGGIEVGEYAAQALREILRQPRADTERQEDEARSREERT